MTHAPLVLPALRGTFGDWIFYSCLMPVSEIGVRADYATEVHPNKALSELIQRSLEGVRARHIADYLAHTEQRFFNSLVLATYGGSPEWLEIGDFKSSSRPELVKQVSQSAMDTLGFLRLTGKERIFAIDGQHRLAGIKKALSEGLDLSLEQAPVLLVGHKKTTAGLQRTRRLFTTLNKTAIPVRKRDIIALDEDDAMAIVVRRLVEMHAAFNHPKIAVIASQNIPTSNRECLTTISSLYDILKLLFMFEMRQRSDRSLRFRRLSDEKLDALEKQAVQYFSALAKAFRPVGRLFAAKDAAKVTPDFRGPHGGHLLFRPIGLEIFTRVAIELASKQRIELSKAVSLLKDMPMDLSKAPFYGVIWDPDRQIIITRGKVLAREIMRYMHPLEPRFVEDYRLSLDAFIADTSRLKLPQPIL